jgi:hypothetical protein
MKDKEKLPPTLSTLLEERIMINGHFEEFTGRSLRTSTGCNRGRELNMATRDNTIFYQFNCDLLTGKMFWGEYTCRHRSYNLIFFNSGL